LDEYFVRVIMTGVLRVMVKETKKRKFYVEKYYFLDF